MRGGAAIVAPARINVIRKFPDAAVAPGVCRSSVDARAEDVPRVGRRSSVGQDGGPLRARVVGAHYPARAPPADPLTGARRRRKRARRPDGLCRFRRRAPCGPSRVRAGGLDARPRAQPRRRTICAAAGRATEPRPRAAAMGERRTPPRRRGSSDLFHCSVSRVLNIELSWDLPPLENTIGVSEHHPNSRKAASASALPP